MSLGAAPLWTYGRTKTPSDGVAGSGWGSGFRGAASLGWYRLNGQQFKSDRETIEIVKKRAALVREIFDLACSGYGIYSIASILNQRREPRWGTPKSNRDGTIKAKTIDWHASYIKKILSNRAVLGEFQPHKLEVTTSKKHVRVPVGDPIKGYYPRIIQDDIFRSAALAMERRRVAAKGRKGSGYSNILTGLIRCEKCGSSMRYLDKGPPPKGGKYLRCSFSVLGGSCEKKAYRYELVEDFVLSMLDALDVQKILGGPSKSRSLGEKRTQSEITRLEVEGIEKKIAALNALLLQDTDAPPRSTLTMIRDLERSLLDQQNRLNVLDNEVTELLTIKPWERDAVVRDLLSSIRDTDEGRRTRARRALASELQRVIASMSIGPDNASDHIEPASRRTKLDLRSDDQHFVLNITYVDGNSEMLRSMHKDHFKKKWHDALKVPKQLIRAK